MKEKILNTANEMFLTLGFKSVTMDDIAEKMSISKKTIYTFYKTKSKLVEACVMDVFNAVSHGIDQICIIGLNPIEELFEVKDFVLNHLKSEKSSPLFQLKKYYTKFFYELQKKQFEVMSECVQENLRKGIEQGLYRKEIDIDFISRIYFSGITMIKDIELFPKGKQNMQQLQTEYLEYHIRAIATDKGIKELEKMLKNDYKK
jgi:AcrR family transcriptional regulator